MLLDAAHLRAEVRRLEPHGDAFGLDERDERVGDLLTEPLLDGEPAREEPDEPGQLGDADDPLARDVADVRVAVEGQRVVLAERGERDRPLDDLRERLPSGGVALGRERRHELGIAVVPGRRLEERAQEALGGVPRPRRPEREPERLEDLRHVAPVSLPVLRRRSRGERQRAVRPSWQGRRRSPTWRWLLPFQVARVTRTRTTASAVCWVASPRLWKHPEGREARPAADEAVGEAVLRCVHELVEACARGPRPPASPPSRSTGAGG